MKMYCPHCNNDDRSLLEYLYPAGTTKYKYFCNSCSKTFYVEAIKDDSEREDKTGRKDTEGKVSGSGNS